MQRSQLYSHTARCLPWPLTNHWLIPLIQVPHPSYYSSSPPWWLTSQPAVYPSSWGSRMLFASCIQSYTYSSSPFPLQMYFEIALHADQGWIFKNVSLVSSSSGSFPPRSPSDFSIWFLNQGGYPIPWICPVHTAQDTEPSSLPRTCLVYLQPTKVLPLQTCSPLRLFPGVYFTPGPELFRSFWMGALPLCYLLTRTPGIIWEVLSPTVFLSDPTSVFPYTELLKTPPDHGFLYCMAIQKKPFTVKILHVTHILQDHEWNKLQNSLTLLPSWCRKPAFHTLPLRVPFSPCTIQPELTKKIGCSLTQDFFEHSPHFVVGKSTARSCHIENWFWLSEAFEEFCLKCPHFGSLAVCPYLQCTWLLHPFRI